MSEKSVSQTILDHLNTGKIEGYNSPVQALVAWGADLRFMGHDDPYIKGLGSLKIKVFASLFKGVVRIEARPNVSTYDVFFENHEGKSGNLVTRASIMGVKPEHLGQVIDIQLEGEVNEKEKAPTK